MLSLNIEGVAMTSLTEYANYLELEQRLYKTRSRWRGFLIAENAFLFAALALGVFFFAVLLEGLFHFGPNGRWFLFITVFSVAGFSLIRWGLIPLFREPSIEEVARHIERAFPEIDNGLINMVLLAKDPFAKGSIFLPLIVDEVYHRSRDKNFEASIETERITRRGLISGLFLAFIALYVLLFPARFSSAFSRVTRPWANVAAVGGIVIKSVVPGDCEIVAGSDLTIDVEIENPPVNEISANIFYEFSNGSSRTGTLLRPDPYRRDLYRFSLAEVKLPLSYYVRMGDTESRTFNVSVVPRPLITGIDLHYEYPEYTGLEPYTEENSSGNITAPVGSFVTVEARTNRPVKGGRFLLNATEEKRLNVEADKFSVFSKLYIETNGFYTIEVVDEKGYRSSEPIQYSITAVPDQVPLLQISVPGRDVALPPGESLRLVVKARDDYGFSEVSIKRLGPEGAEEVLHQFDNVAGKKDLTLPVKLAFPSDKYKPGEEITYFAYGRDNCEIPGPHEARSVKFKVKIVDTEEVKKEMAGLIDRWLKRLLEILKIQKKARAGMDEIAGILTLDAFRSKAAAIYPDQKEVRSGTLTVAAEMASGPEAIRKVRQVLLALSAREMADAITGLEELQNLKDLVYKDAPVSTVTAAQDTIIEILQQILDILPKIKERVLSETPESEKFDLPPEVEAKWRKLLDDLKKFAEQQKKVIEASENLLKLPVDNFTPENEKKLKELKALEDDWAKLLKEDFMDLSKLPNQDFSNPSLLKELVECYEEVEKAADAISKKTLELAVPLEQSGLELADELTTHIEKWLPDTADREQWKMEEPLEDVDVPMAELPEQLEDLVGELMEQEEDLFEEMADITSAWADSIDKGAGWDALDGPISNMSAQGVTGNRLPDSHEIGGRSGEGRTGKAHGEMVGDTAVGKGGRRTPSRLTPDAYQAGEIKDISREPPGGATGGGKLSGAGSPGLEGPVPPDVQRRMARLSGRQAQLRNRAEKVDVNFKVVGYPSSELEKAIEEMKKVERDINAGRYMNALRRRGVILEGLSDTRMFLAGEWLIRKDRSVTLPGPLQEEIRDSLSKPCPKGYEELLRRYYQALSEAK